MEPWLLALSSAVAVSLSAWVGLALLSVRKARLRLMADWLVALAVGALLGDVFLHLLPRAYETIPQPETVGLLALAGLLAFYLLDAGLRSRHRHHHHVHIHERAVPMVLIGDGLHNFVDGVLIAVSYMADVHFGLATTLAILLHELPQEMGDFGVLVRSGLSARKALVYNFYSALAAVVGAATGLLVGQQVGRFAEHMLPIAAGNFLYLALATLVPLMQGRVSFARSLPRFLVVVLGIAVMYALGRVVPHHHPGLH